MKQTPSWSTLVIKFQTAPNIPAPYSYFYTLELRAQKPELAAKLTLRYLDRDELDEDSILDEGFTLDDDYEWEGTLPEAWNEVLIKSLDTSTLSTENNGTENDNYLEAEFYYASGKKESYFPEGEEWDYFQHEVLQAIYEISGKEFPFVMEYREIDHKNELKIKVEASFAHRRLEVTINDDTTKVLDWTLTQEIMQTVFRVDFLPEYASEAEPKGDGKYLTTGDGLWYEFGESLVEPTPKSKLLPQIIKLLDRLR